MGQEPERWAHLPELTRRQLLKAAGAAAATTASAVLVPASPLPPDRAGAAATPAWNHDPQSSIGPPRWDDIGFPTCGDGRLQSPVDVRTGEVVVRRGGPLRLSYRRSQVS